MQQKTIYGIETNELLAEMFLPKKQMPVALSSTKCVFEIIFTFLALDLYDFVLPQYQIYRDNIF